MTRTAVHVLTTLADRDRADRTDGQLLDSFVRTHDPAAFEALVRRHGPMVLGVCRRVLRNPADADDAFQAAFLVLARKAAGLGPREVLAGFLHHVAFNTARKLRRANLRRAARETPLDGVAEPSAVEPDGVRDELLAALDEELSRLPDRYRVPIVLCDLEGVTRKEAAARLGWPEGTVAGRLARGRARLAERLAARGVAPAAGVVVMVPGAAVAGVVRVVSGGEVPARVGELTRGVLTAMFAKKLRAAAAVVLSAGLALAGAYRVATAGADPAAPPPAQAEPAPPPKPAPGDGRSLTVVPLAKLDPEATAKVIADAFKGKGVTVAGVANERLLLLYADEKVTAEIRQLLQKLGEAPPPQARVIRLKKAAAGEAAGVLNEVFRGSADRGVRRITAVPVAGANALLVYGDPTVLQSAEELLEQLDASTAPPPAKPAAESKTYTVSFTAAPWATVLDWFAAESGLTPIYSVKPTGSVTLRPPKDKKFTLGEVVDLLNEAMLQQKFILVRRQVSFTILPADEKIDPSSVPRIDLADLSKRGKTELVQVLLPLKTLAVEDVAPEVRKMLGPFGATSSLARTNTLILMDTAGNLQRIVQTLRKVEEGNAVGDILTHKFVYQKAVEAAERLKVLLTDKDTAVTVGGAPDAGGGAAGRVKSVVITVDVKGNSVTVTGTPEKIALAKRIIVESDKPRPPGPPPAPVREVRTYPVPPGTADSIAGGIAFRGFSFSTTHPFPGRVMALSDSNEVLVYGTPEEHAAMAARIKDLVAELGKKEPEKR